MARTWTLLYNVFFFLNPSVWSSQLPWIKCAKHTMTSFATRPFETSLGYWKILTCNPELACCVFTYLKLNSLHTLHCFLYFLKKLPVLPVLGKERKKKAQVLKSKSLLKKTLSTTLAIINPFLISAVWKKTISVLLKEAHLRSPPPPHLNYNKINLFESLWSGSCFRVLCKSYLY